MIPDVPYAVKERIKREKYLTHVILHETSLKLVTRRLKPLIDDKISHDATNFNKEEIEMKATLTPIEENNWHIFYIDTLLLDLLCVQIFVY